MAWTAERKRARRAELVAARAADDAARGIKRRPRGPVPVNHHWDERAQIYVLDAPVPHTAQPADVPPDRFAWAVAHPPPRRDEFASHAQWDAVREPWYATLMGKTLPPYGNNKARTAAWISAIRRHSRYTAMSEQRAEREREKKEAEHEAERVRKAEAAAQEALDAPLIKKLIECERHNKLEYHPSCKQWHHPKVPCDKAHLYPMSKLPLPLADLKQYLTGTMHVAGYGAIVGERAEWPLLGLPMKCKCLPENHPRFFMHDGGKHVHGCSVFDPGDARRELGRRNGVKL